MSYKPYFDIVNLEKKNNDKDKYIVEFMQISNHICLFLSLKFEFSIVATSFFF